MHTSNNLIDAQSVEAIYIKSGAYEKGSTSSDSGSATSKLATEKDNSLLTLFNTSTKTIGKGGYGTVKKVKIGKKNYAVKQQEATQRSESEAKIFFENVVPPKYFEVETSFLS